jgi:ABC-2 type transport system permease protein
MSSQAGVGAAGGSFATQSGQQGTARGALAFLRSQPFYWAVRRELWEYRSIYVAPLGIGAVIAVSSLFPLLKLPNSVRNAMTLDPVAQRDVLSRHYEMAAVLIMGAAFLVSIYYALDCLYGERRDRSILFWKSLPVSDLMTVLAKASIPLLVIPAIAFLATLATELIMLMTSSAVLLANGLSVTWYWSVLRPFSSMFLLAYHLVTVHFLWYAPNYAFLLLISAWAKRAPILWAALPLFAIAIF